MVYGIIICTGMGHVRWGRGCGLRVCLWCVQVGGEGGVVYVFVCLLCVQVWANGAVEVCRN